MSEETQEQEVVIDPVVEDTSGDDPVSPFLDEETPAAAEKVEDKAEEPAAAAATEPEKPEYEPTSFKVRSFGRDIEIDDAFRPLMTDEASEKKVRELFEKAHGMDEYRRRDAEKGEYLQQVEPVLNTVRVAAEALEKNDIDGFLKALQVSEQTMYKWVAEKIKFAELPEEQKAAYNQRKLAEERAASLQASNDHLQSERNSYMASQRSFDLDQGLAKASVKTVASTWDSIYGAGAFKREVQETGASEFMRNQVDLSAEQAINKVIERIQPLVSRLGSAPQAPAPVKRLAVIPNAQGKSGTPAKKAIRTLDDIKRLAASMD